MNSSKRAICLYLRGTSLSRRGEFRRSIAVYTRALQSDPHQAKAYASRGAARLDMGDFAGSLADFDMALTLDPGMQTVLASRASARNSVGDFVGARADCQEALAQNSKSAEAFANLGASFQGERNYTAAIEQFDLALQLNPRLFWAYLLRGNCHYHLEHLDAVCEDYRQAFQLDASLAASHIARHFVRNVELNAERELADCDEHLQKAPGDWLTSLRRSITLLILGRDAEAEASLRNAKALNAQDAEYFQMVVDFVMQRRSKNQEKRPFASTQSTWESSVAQVFAEEDALLSLGI